MTSREIVPIAQAVQAWTPADQAVIRRMVAKDADDSEFKVFLYQAWKWQLDPLSKEMYAIRYKAGAPISFVVAIGGFIAIAHRTGQYGGFQAECVYDQAGKLVGAVATIWRRDSEHPTVINVKFSEYNTNLNEWAKRPETMIKKVAAAQAFRYAFNIAGLYAPEEMGSNEEAMEGEYRVVAEQADPQTGELPPASSNGHAAVNAGRSALRTDPTPSPAPTPLRRATPTPEPAPALTGRAAELKALRAEAVLKRVPPDWLSTNFGASSADDLSDSDIQNVRRALADLPLPAVAQARA